jgi:hypothetical protein
MRHIGSLTRSLLLGFVACSMLASSSYADPVKMEITIGEPMQTIMDNGAGDTNPAVGTIGFSVNGAGWTATGTVIEKLAPPNFASLTFTKVTVARVAGGPAGAVLVPYDIFTDVFAPPIPPISMASATLAGSFVDVGVQGNVSVDMSANACMPIGGNLVATPPPLAFNKTTGMVAINCATTQLEILGLFSVTDVGDMVLLPGSADALDAIPEPPSLLLFAIGCAGLLIFRRLRVTARR